MSQHDRIVRLPELLGDISPISPSSDTYVMALEKKAGKDHVGFFPSRAGYVNEEVDTESLDKDWESDPANPRNWSSGKKWAATVIVGVTISVTN
jgi:hypothetical protein